MKCVLVEEINGQNIPPNLKILISSLESPSTSDYVVVALYTLMIESGFIPLDVQIKPPTNSVTGYGFDAGRMSTYCSLPVDWKEENPKSYQMKFQLGEFSEHKLRLIVLELCDILILDLIVGNTPLVESGLPESLFSTTVCPGNHVSSGPNVEYKNMKELAYKFKNIIASPARATILNKYGILNPSLLGLPDEVLLKLLKYLKISEVATVMRVCSCLRDLSEDTLLWQYLFQRDNMKTPPDGGDREINYKRKYSKALAWSKRSCPAPMSQSENPTRRLFVRRLPRFGIPNLPDGGYEFVRF